MSAEQAASALREDLNSFVRAELERALNDALEAEIEDFLLEASSERGDKIYRNGYYGRVLKSRFGPLSLRVPRDRMAPFSKPGCSSLTRERPTTSNTSSRGSISTGSPSAR